MDHIAKRYVENSIFSEKQLALKERAISLEKKGNNTSNMKIIQKIVNFKTPTLHNIVVKR